MEAYSRQKPFVNGFEELRAIAPEAADGFQSFRKVINEMGSLEPKQRELCLLAGFAVARNERGFRIHCNMASGAGATLKEVQQVVLLMMGSNIGLMPALDALSWAKDEFDGLSASK